MWNPQTQAPLLEAARTGDPAALNRLLAVCRPNVRRYAQRHCLLNDVDDAVQEALLSVSRHLGSLRVAAAFTGWLVRIVQRECRRLGRITLRYDPYDEATLEAWLGSRDDDTLRHELAQALEALPPHYREVVLLRDFEERTIAEMATALALTVPATKSRLHRARQLMREYLLS
jgi:RNA polymerase sigma factor (sigma-70 family)